MGVRPELNHTTATQIQGWKDTILDFCTKFNGHPDSNCIVDPARVWQLARGYLGDHAADQEKLLGMLEAYSRECDREICGEDALLSEHPQDEAEQD